MISVVSDVNILIDMEVAGLTERMFSLSMDFAIPDVLFEEEVDQQQKYIQCGLRPVSLNPEGVNQVIQYANKYQRTSRNDLFALVLAKLQRSILLTGDAALRKAAETEEVEVHGSIWLIKRMLSEQLLNRKQASQAFKTMKLSGRRLPWHLAQLDA